jgi:phospholipase/carboxylesterase
MSVLSGPRFGPTAGGRAQGLVVLCHGVGSDGDDLISLAPMLAAKLPNILFASPHGPEPYDMAPSGRQWFSLADRRLAPMEAGVRIGRQALDQYVDATLAELHLPATAYALAGFSQGAMVALFAGLRRAAAPRAILAYSGMLLGPDKLAEEMANHAPVLMVHGEQDEVVPAKMSRMGAKVLERLGVPTHLVLRPDLGHSIDNAGVAEGVAALAKAFASPAPAA